MQQEIQGERPFQVRKHAEARLAFWLSVMGLGVLLVPAEYFFLFVYNAHIPWFVGTLGVCFVAGVLCALVATIGLESRRISAILLRGFTSSCCAGLLNICLWFVFLFTSGVYSIYHPSPPVTGRWAPTLPPSWALLMLVLVFFLGIAAVHLLAILLGGTVGGLSKGIIVQMWPARKEL